MSFEKLLSPVQIGSMHLKNRCVVPPMETNYAGVGGFVSQRTIDYYTTRAKGGYGLIVIEIIAVDPVGMGDPFGLGIWSDEHIPGFRKLTDSIHENGAKVLAQIYHSGRQTDSSLTGGVQPIAPSPIPCPLMKEMPREMKTEEIYRMIDKFVEAAQRAKKAGFDGVEVHGAHGYLISQFMSAYFNKRIDEFGGDLISRMKFPVEIVRKIREALGPDFVIQFRISADEMVPGGRTIHETRAAARIMEKAVIVSIHVSICTYGSIDWMFVTGEIPAGFNSTAAEEVKKSVKIPVISVGRYNDPCIAEDVLLSGKADLISFGRESLADPELPNKLAEGRLDEIIPCIGCLQGCAGYMFDPEKLKITCLMNPFTGKEGTHKIEPTRKVKKVIVVGAGPGGLEASWILAKRGHQVTCYEKEQQIGGQFRIGGMPPTKQDIMKGVKYQLTMCNKFGVEIITGTEATPELILAKKADAVVLATGGTPLYPNIKGIKNPNLLNAIDVLDAKKQYGQKVIVIGGGMVGAETADFLCERGCDVTVVEMRSGIALDVLEGPAKQLRSRLERCKATIITDAAVSEIFEDGIMYQSEGKDMKISGFDNVVLALGTMANNPLEKALQGKVNELYTIGDAVKARKAIDAMEEAIEVAIRI